MANAAESPSSTTSSTGGAESFVVVAKDSASLPAARTAVTSAGGTVTSEDSELGLLTATSSASDFATKADQSTSVVGVAHNRRIGSTPKRDQVMDDAMAALQSSSATSTAHRKPAPKAEPLADLQWDMKMIGATPSGSYQKQRGNKGVRVGIIDTGVDGSHPDIKPNFDEGLSRNFVQDMSDIDGATCEHPESDCVDPVDEDDDGHGTHVAGTIGAPINGIGIAGVAPKVTLVNIRAGQDSGYFFLEPTIKALRYAGHAGIDVVNMSFYIDPWLFNCTANPKDSAEDQAEQRAIIEATQRALRSAHRHGVTLVAALGNEHTDLGKPGVDASSPDYPKDSDYARTIDNATCLSLPAEGKNVISVSSIGPSGKKADYSNYGLEQNDVSAPGGFFRDFVATSKYNRPENLVLAPMPRNVAVATKDLIDPKTGTSKSPLVISRCNGTGPSHCTYWQYLQGTSMATPHAVGVAALIVAEYGKHDDSGMTLSPDKVDRILRSSATDKDCPASVITYTAEGRDITFNARCVGDAERNSIYGDGVINANRAVSGEGD